MDWKTKSGGFHDGIVIKDFQYIADIELEKNQLA